MRPEPAIGLGVRTRAARLTATLDTPLMTTLVLLPGMDGTGLLFGPLVDALAGKLQVEVVRYRSAAPAGYSELERVAEACLPTEGPLILLGNLSLARLQSHWRRSTPAGSLVSSFAVRLYAVHIPLSRNSAALPRWHRSGGCRQVLLQPCSWGGLRRRSFGLLLAKRWQLFQPMRCGPA